MVKVAKPRLCGLQATKSCGMPLFELGWFVVVGEFAMQPG
jgi:hypothetical protein